MNPLLVLDRSGTENEAAWDEADACPSCLENLPGRAVVDDLLGGTPLACDRCGAVLRG